jgi:hypothetical protein
MGGERAPDVVQHPGAILFSRLWPGSAEERETRCIVWDTMKFPPQNKFPKMPLTSAPYSPLYRLGLVKPG